MPPTPESENEPPEPSAPDVVDVIDRAALIENVINQIIVGYCKPRKEAWEFRVIALRNAFAHHASNAHPVLVVGRTPEEDTSHLQFWVLETSGKIFRIKRHEAFNEFNAAYRTARESLLQLRSMVGERYERSDA